MIYRLWLFAVPLVIFTVTSAAKAQVELPRDFVRGAQCVAISNDGELAATAKSGLSNGAPPLRPHPNPKKCGTIEIWELATGKRLHRIESYGDFTQIAFSPSGEFLATARLFTLGDGVELNEVRLWNVKTGKSHYAFDRAHGFAFHPGGDRILMLSRFRCVFFTLEGIERGKNLEPLSGAVRVVLSPDGSKAAGIVEDDQSGAFHVRLCDTKTGKQLAETQAVKTPFYGLARSPDGDLLATGHPGGFVILWKFDELRPLRRLVSFTPGHLQPFFSPDGKLLAAGDQQKGTTVFWSTESWKEIRRWRFDRGSFRTYYPRKAETQVRPELNPVRYAFTPDGEAFLAGCYGGILRRVDEGSEVRRFRPSF